MPSKKKKKQKAPKKAAKAKADKEVGGKDTAMVAVDSEMQRLKIDEAALDDEDKLLEDAMKLAAAEKVLMMAFEKCRHGYLPRSSKEGNYCDRFATAFLSESSRGYDSYWSMDKTLKKSMAATKKQFPGVWRNQEKLELSKSFCLARGAINILIGEIGRARCAAFAANFMEQWIDITLSRTKTEFDLPKLIELLNADEHTLVSYVRTRIPCTCLDLKHKEVKSIKKMGWCNNPTCSHDNTVERSTMLSCTRCRWANYCSQECQTQHWKIHKKICCDVSARLILSEISSGV